MKKTLFGAASIAALLIAGSVFAAPATHDTSTVTQPGSGNTADVDQTLTGGDNTATSSVDQESDNNQATVKQGGSQNISGIYQNTDADDDTGSDAKVTQTGASGNVVVNQYGANTASVKQDVNSSGETAIVIQTGNNTGGSPASGIIYQNGLNETGWILQTGNGNTSTVSQTGNPAGGATTGVGEPINPGGAARGKHSAGRRANPLAEPSPGSHRDTENGRAPAGSRD